MPLDGIDLHPLFRPLMSLFLTHPVVHRWGGYTATYPPFYTTRNKRSGRRRILRRPKRRDTLHKCGGPYTLGATQDASPPRALTPLPRKTPLHECGARGCPLRHIIYICHIIYMYTACYLHFTLRPFTRTTYTPSGSGIVYSPAGAVVVTSVRPCASITARRSPPARSHTCNTPPRM